MVAVINVGAYPFLAFSDLICMWKYVPTTIDSGVDISKVPGCHFLRQMVSQ